MIEIKVNGMECEMCVKRISKALAEEKINADILLEGKSVRVFEDADADKACVILGELGFTPER